MEVILCFIYSCAGHQLGENFMLIAFVDIWLQLQPSSSWPRRRKRSKMFSLCTTRITRTILLGCIWIFNFHLKIVIKLRRRHLIPIRCDNGKRKIWPWRWLYRFDFQHWRWLHALMTMVASVPATIMRFPPVLFVLNITPQILMKTLFVDKQMYMIITW